MRPTPISLLFLAINIAILASCASETKTQRNALIIHDTIEVIKHTIDTVFITQKADSREQQNLIIPRLPDWFVKSKLLDDLILKDDYIFDNRLNPMYLEEDFNGDHTLDLAIPIKHIVTGKAGFAVIHGNTTEVHILGAGVPVKNGLSDNLKYVNIWKINRLKTNEPGLDESGEVNPNGPLHLTHPSIEIEKSDLGGGQLYWDGEEYVYFHQSC
ncbi:MAG: hypothetical protein ACI84C_001058 [Flavobacteriales bacterium]|jgi:hypothetical protein